jgi:hypothetical protein
MHRGGHQQGGGRLRTRSDSGRTWDESGLLDIARVNADFELDSPTRQPELLANMPTSQDARADSAPIVANTPTTVKSSLLMSLIHTSRAPRGLLVPFCPTAQGYAWPKGEPCVPADTEIATQLGILSLRRGPTRFACIGTTGNKNQPA